MSFADPVRTSVWTITFSLVSNFFSVVKEETVCAMMEFDTSCFKCVFIWSIASGGLVRSSTTGGIGERGIVKILFLWSNVALSEIALET